MNNVFFVKTIENIRERINLNFISHTQVDQINKRQSKLSFENIADHYSTFSVYKFGKEKTLFDKPLYLGSRVLELSKLLLYEFLKKNSEPYWLENVKLHYVDTDSFILSFSEDNKEVTNFLQQNKKNCFSMN